MEITLDGGTKIVMADAIRLDRRRTGEPIDFAADTILIIDPDTLRPVATIRPIPGAPKAAPRVVTAPSPRPAPAAESATAELPRIAPEGGPKPGRLTEAEQEKLERLWRLNPDRTTGWIGAEFARTTGRTLSPATVEKYRGAGAA